MKRKKMFSHVGSDFDTFLEKEGILEEVEMTAIKRIISYELQEEMSKKSVTLSDMAKRLGTSRSALRRLLDPKNYSITLLTLNRVAQALGKRLEIKFN